MYLNLASWPSKLAEAFVAAQCTRPVWVWDPQVHLYVKRDDAPLKFTKSSKKRIASRIEGKVLNGKTQNIQQLIPN